MKEKPDFRLELRLQEYSPSRPCNPAPVLPLLDLAAGQGPREHDTATADTAAIPEYRH